MREQVRPGLRGQPEMDPSTDPVRMRADIDHLKERQERHEDQCGERWRELRGTMQRAVWSSYGTLLAMVGALAGALLGLW